MTFRSAALVCLISALASFTATAQMRTGADIDSKTFVMGLDSYFCGLEGGLNFQHSGRPFMVTLSANTVNVGPATEGAARQEVYRNGLQVPFRNSFEVPKITGDYVVGVHDFTGDSQPELVIAVKDASISGVEVYVLRLSGESWVSAGEIAAFGGGISECRIFRQAVTIKNPSTGALYSWTFHTDRFDFKASDGTKDPETLIK